MLNLIVHAKHQHLITQFFESILPTIDDQVKIYAVTEGLDLPNDPRVIRFDRTEFRPGKYFNLILNELKGQDGYLGIINDDILFHPSWYQDIKEKLKMCYCVSAGFVETLDHDHFLERVEATKNLQGVEVGIHNAFSVMPIWMAEKIGGFDEDAVWWYDMSMFLQVLKLGYKWTTSQKVTIQHLERQTIIKDELPRREIRDEVWSKWGRKGQLLFKYNSIHLRGIFNV